MIKYISQKIVEKLSKDKVIDYKLRSVYIYGFEILISNILGFSTVITLGMIFDKTLNSVYFLIILLSLRIYTGGYHAKNYFYCNLILNLSFLICLFVSKNCLINLNLLYILELPVLILATIIIFIFIPLENKNKPIRNKKMIYKLKSASLYTIYFVVGFYTHFKNLKISTFIFSTLNFTIIILIIEILRRRFCHE